MIVGMLNSKSDFRPRILFASSIVMISLLILIFYLARYFLLPPYKVIYQGERNDKTGRTVFYQADADAKTQGDAVNFSNGVGYSESYITRWGDRAPPRYFVGLVKAIEPIDGTSDYLLSLVNPLKQNEQATVRLVGSKNDDDFYTSLSVLDLSSRDFRVLILKKINNYRRGEIKIFIKENDAISVIFRQNSFGSYKIDSEQHRIVSLVTIRRFNALEQLQKEGLSL